MRVFWFLWAVLAMFVAGLWLRDTKHQAPAAQESVEFIGRVQ